MDEDEWLRGELNKINFLMELIWTEEMFSHGLAPDDMEAVSERALAKWELHLGETPAASDEYTAARLAEFFVRLRERLEVKHREELLRRGRGAGPR
jgi:hypothetical protein